MDRRRLLGLPVLHHPAGHHVPVATVGQQPEVEEACGALRLPAAADAQLVSLRYAFSPLLDEESEEEEKEPMMNEAFGQKASPGFLVAGGGVAQTRCLCLQRG